MKIAGRIFVLLSFTVSTHAQSFEVAESSIADEQKAMTEGRVTSKALVQAYLNRIDAFDLHGPRLNSLITVNPNALKEAEALDRERAAKGPRGPLHGIPVILKDNYSTTDMPTTAGTMALLGFLPAKEAFQVQKLRAAGAVIIGKSNLHELASGITTISSAGGQTLNPYDPTRNPGGSSGGTGAAIAASFAAAGMGSDTCGSIRIPSSHNNLVGLRPTKGLSSIAGVVPLSVSQDVAGPLARSVEDLAIMLDATIGEDPDDPATVLPTTRKRPTFTSNLQPGSLAGARIGVLEPLFGDATDDQDVLRVVRASIEEMKKAGAVAVPINMPELTAAIDGSSLIDFEFQEDLKQYLTQNPGAPVSSLAEIFDKGLFSSSLEAVFKRRLASKGRGSEAYRQALAKRAALTQAILKRMDDEKLDVLLYPTIRRKPAHIGDPQAGSTCQLSASTGFPALSMPAGFTPDGIPVGVELFGRPFDDAKLVSLAYSYEKATHHRQAPARTPALIAGKAPASITWQTSGKAQGSAAQVTAKFSFDPSTSELTYNVTAAGFPKGDLRAATIHRVAKDDAGPSIVLLSNHAFQNVAGREVISNPDREKLLSGATYLLISTSSKDTTLRIPLVPSH